MTTAKAAPPKRSAPSKPGGHAGKGGKPGGGGAKPGGGGGGKAGGARPDRRPAAAAATGAKRPAPAGKPGADGGTAPPAGKRPKRNEDLIKAITTKWERLRRADTPAEERAALAGEVLSAARGAVARLAMSHTASRVLQAAVRFAPPPAVAAAVAEVRAEAVPLAKSSYGHFLVVKLIANAPKEEIADWLKLYRGHLAGLLRHPTGAAVVDELYTRATPAQRDGMAAEFYSREYVLFPAAASGAAGGGGAAPASLAAALDGAPPARRAAILQRLATQVTPILDKGMLDPALTHRLVAEYLGAAPPRAAADAVDALAGPALMRMVHTRDGAAAACAVLALGTAKDRKKAVKAMKGHVATMARDEWASAVLAAALTHTDDTQLLTKVIGAELGAALEAGDALTSLLAHKHARRVLLQVLEPGSTRYLPPHTLALVYPVTAAGEAAKKAAAAAAAAAQAAGAENGGEAPAPPPPAAANAAAATANGDGDSGGGEPSTTTATAVLGVSKKDGDKRRREVLGSGPASLGAKLLAAATTAAPALLRGPGADVLVEAARGGGRDGVLLAAHGPGVEALREAVLAQAAAPLAADEEKAEAGNGEAGGAAAAAAAAAGKDGGGAGSTHALTDFYASRALKHFALLAVPGGEGGGGGGGGAAAAPGVAAAAEGARALWTRALAGRAGRLAGGHAAKVLAAVWVALVAAGASEEVEAARRELGDVVGDVEAWAGGVLKAGEK